MTALLVVFMFAGFALLDIVVRRVGHRLDERRARRERAAVLDSSLRADYAAEAKTLKRVEVPAARARILAVDDEEVVLDSFRKILVLAGYSVDTVQSGPEALGLLQRNDYDLVFTDLKMPDMDGVEVVKSVRQLRPDVDVAVVTGYGTIETAVATMQHGAVDYVQKPFTEDELVAFARRLVIKRSARQEAARRPLVRTVAPAAADEVRPHEYLVAGGAFLSGGHDWARLEPSGGVRVGIDDFARRCLGTIDGVELPAVGQAVHRGEALFAVRRGDQTARFAAPVSGTVRQTNAALSRRPALAVDSPYEDGWFCVIEPSDLSGDLRHLHIGQAAIDWYQAEIERLRNVDLASGDLRRLQQEFLSAAEARPVASA